VLRFLPVSRANVGSLAVGAESCKLLPQCLLFSAISRGFKRHLRFTDLRFIDDIISMWDINRGKIEEFLSKANNFHPTIKFTAEILETETIFPQGIYT